MQLGGSVVVTSRAAEGGQGTGPAVGSFDAANQANTSSYTQPTDTHTPRDELEAAARVRQVRGSPFSRWLCTQKSRGLPGLRFVAARLA